MFGSHPGRQAPVRPMCSSHKVSSCRQLRSCRWGDSRDHRPSEPGCSDALLSDCWWSHGVVNLGCCSTELHTHIHTCTRTRRQTESKPHQLLNHHLEETPLLGAISACLLPCVREPFTRLSLWQFAITSQRMSGHNNMRNTTYLNIPFSQYVPCRIYYSCQIFYSHLWTLQFSLVCVQHE